MLPDDLPPIEKYSVDNEYIYVVRDDLCSAFPGPNNSKVRGLYKKLLALKEGGVKTVATQDTSISRAGWGVSWLCKQLDMTNINFYAERKEMNFYQRMSQYHGGIMVPLHGTYSSGFRAMAINYLRKNNISAYFLPNGLATQEAVIGNAELYLQLPEDLKHGTIICSVSSGAICSGISYGASIEHKKTRVIGVLSSSFKNRQSKMVDFMRSANLILGRPHTWNIPEVVDLGYEYKDTIKEAPPFPCDIFMDRKAWKYLLDNINTLPKPIVFWNVGGEWNPEKGLTSGLRGDGNLNKDSLEAYLRQ